jgi:hypothetical protein
MSLFCYEIHFDDGTPMTEMVVYASDEGTAFRKVEARYPSWSSVELVHTYVCKEA